MTTIILTFETAEQANNAVLALSNGYSVEQWTNTLSIGRPYCVRFTVSDDDIEDVED